jgi:hypothetical protein
MTRQRQLATALQPRRRHDPGGRERALVGLGVTLAAGFRLYGARPPGSVDHACRPGGRAARRGAAGCRAGGRPLGPGRDSVTAGGVPFAF